MITVDVEIKDVTGEFFSFRDEFSEKDYDNLVELARSLKKLDYLIFQDHYFNPNNVIYMAVKRQN